MTLAIGIIGAGKLGVALARVAVDAGCPVMVAATSRENTRLILSVMAPGAGSGTVPEVAAFADIVVLAVPLHRFRELSPDAFTGKIVVDAINYWQPVDGGIEKFGVEATGTSDLVQAHFATATVVKSLNQLGYHDVDEGRRPRESSDRLGVALAGDDPGANATVARLIDLLGFDPVPVGTLAQGRRLGPGGPAFGATLTAGQLRQALSADRQL